MNKNLKITYHYNKSIIFIIIIMLMFNTQNLRHCQMIISNQPAITSTATCILPLAWMCFNSLKHKLIEFQNNWPKIQCKEKKLRKIWKNCTKRLGRKIETRKMRVLMLLKTHKIWNSSSITISKKIKKRRLINTSGHLYSNKVEFKN